jgi:hypothetical protein
VLYGVGGDWEEVVTATREVKLKRQVIELFHARNSRRNSLSKGGAIHRLAVARRLQVEAIATPEDRVRPIPSKHTTHFIEDGRVRSVRRPRLMGPGSLCERGIALLRKLDGRQMNDALACVRQCCN